MDNSQRYKLLAQGEIFQPSVMGIVPSERNFEFKFTTIQNMLNSSKYFIVKRFTIDNDSEISENDFCVVTIEYNGESYAVRIQISETADLRLDDYSNQDVVEDKDCQVALSQPYFAEVSMIFGQNTINSFYLQLKILDTIIPNASLVVDFISLRLFSAKWLKMAIESNIPPSPSYLYTLHSVYEEKLGKTEYWFHTHGLIRCGCPELEIINVTSGPQQMFDLMNIVVKRFLSSHIAENTKFAAGFDGLDLNLIWLRWEEALTDFPDDILGALKDRVNIDDIHREPSGILYAVEDQNLVSPEIYVSTLSKNPILYISTEESARMSELAKKRYDYFLNIYTTKGYKDNKSFWKKIFKKKPTDPWSFLVKLGLEVDGAENPTEREHLWFDVKSADDKSITGILMNQPYWISSLNEGDIKTYPIELLTDWLIYDSQGRQYSPDTVYLLNFIYEK